MTSPGPGFLAVGHGADCRRIAMLLDNGPERNGTGIVWLPGFKSEMTSLKATALAEWAAHEARPMTRFDYSGHGRSEGRFEDGTLTRWLEEAETIFEQHTRGHQILVGSSMGGFIALLLLKKLIEQKPVAAARIKALVLIAPAWDMTERLMKPRISAEARRQLKQTGVYLRPSAYGDGPYPITRQLLDDGANHQIGARSFDPGRPVHILHGLQDPDVPWEHTLDLVAHLDRDWTRVTAVPDGDHRLSRPEDLELLIKSVTNAAT